MTDPDTTRYTPPPSAAPTPQAPPDQPAPPPAPAWRPPPADHGRSASLVFGVIVLIVGGWFFATSTLGLDLPDFDWGQLWPIFIIAAGAWIILGALRQRSP